MFLFLLCSQAALRGSVTDLLFLSSYAVFREAKHLSAFIPTEAGLAEERQGVKALLLENVNESGIKLLKDQNYIVDTEKGSLGEDELIQRLNKGEYQILGIRSKTKVTKKIIDSCPSVSLFVPTLAGLLVVR